jgi:uncharacterized protein
MNLNETLEMTTESTSFCNRPLEQLRIQEAIANKKSVFVAGLRRIGKTELIKAALKEVEKEKQSRVFYLDLYPTGNTAEFIRVLAKNTLGKLDSNHLKLMRELANYFSYLRPVIQYDMITGTPLIDFNLDSNYQAEHTIEQIFTYLNRQTFKVILFLDELQQMMSYKEKSTIQYLISHIRKSENITCIYAGSDSQMLDQLKEGELKSYFESIENVNVATIEHDVFRTYLIEQFTANKKVLTEDVADLLLDLCRRHTYYVQYFSNKLLSKSVKQPDTWMVERMMAEILKENEAVYYAYRNLLTVNQWELLKGIAKDKGARQVLSADFIRKNNLGSTSSVQTALAALFEKELIFVEEGRFYVYDVFLSRWLEN